MIKLAFVIVLALFPVIAVRLTEPGAGDFPERLLRPWEWRLDKPIGGLRYFVTGVVLFAMKFGQDSLITWAFFREHWSLLNYWFPSAGGSLQGAGSDLRVVYAALVAAAMPYIWVGVGLTVRRLHSLGWHPALAILFFLPVVNLPFLGLLSVIPSRQSGAAVPNPAAKAAERRLWLDLASVAAASAIAAGMVVLEVKFFAAYGWGIFLGSPFLLGLLTTVLINRRGLRSYSYSLGMASVGFALIGATFVIFAWEGVVCLAMAMPLAFPLAALGCWAGHLCSRAGLRPTLAASCVVLIPLAAGFERPARQPEMTMVRSAIIVHASTQRVWQEVIEFPPLSENRSWLFHTGVAYPIKAEIRGTGVGALRYCIFSTGAFEEPITIWEPGRRLAFGVSKQPPVMNEATLVESVPTHIREQYLRSTAGEFLLTPQPDGSVLLQGTTWYTLRMRPLPYWRWWSDAIIHRIHMRVLEHVKALAEGNP